MSNEFESERDVIDFLWTTYHGPTGFRYRCGCTAAYRRGPIGRSKVCKACRAEISVTADTLMRNTRVSLLAWMDALRTSGIPTVREAAGKYAVASSSAWYLLLRIMRSVEVGTPEQIAHTEVVRVALRARVKPIIPSAPARIVALDQAQAPEVHLEVLFAGRRAWPGVIGVDPPDTAQEPLSMRLVDELRSRGGVSLRWLPRWVAALLGEWSRACARPWWQALRTSPVPLRRLDPWLPAAA